MKKIIAVVLALVMLISCSAIGFAAEETKPEANSSSASADTTKGGSAAGAMNILRQISSFLESNDLLQYVSSTITKIESLINDLSKGNATDVAGIIDELEAKIKELPIAGDILEYLHNLINTLKQKVKDLYSNNVQTSAVVPMATGSGSVGIVAFATISVAAAAAFVCTRKKEN